MAEPDEILDPIQDLAAICDAKIQMYLDCGHRAAQLADGMCGPGMSERWRGVAARDFQEHNRWVEMATALEALIASQNSLAVEPTAP